MKTILPLVRRYILWILLVVLVLLLASAFELGRYSVYRAHPELTSSEQAQAILGQVALLMQLPAGETPTMVTIQDADRAKQGQPFLVNSQNGDVLVIYSNAAEAILYRPSTNKIINVGPVNTGAAPKTSAATPTPTPTPSTPATNTSTATTKKK